MRAFDGGNMRLGIMQPYFFPYLGYFDLINSTDRWIVFDTVQYIRHGWINRNRILHPNEGWQYIIVPIMKAKREETMPEDSCFFFYECTDCGTLLKPKSGDCCVFCSFGSVPCPPVQEDKECCK